MTFTADELAAERWLPVVGWEGLYEVSDLGRVRSLPAARRCKNGDVRRYPGCILAGRACGGGYRMITLSREGGANDYFVHSLVLTAFHGPKPDRRFVARYINGVRADSRAANLMWGPRAAPPGYDGQHPPPYHRGEQHPQCKLTTNDVVEMRAKRATGESLEGLAAEYGVSRSNVWTITTRLTWRHVP